MSDTLYDYWDTGDDDWSHIYGSNWIEQSFIASASYSITSISVRLIAVGDPDILTASIRATDPATHKPTGNDLASGTIDISAITTLSWVEVSMSVPVTLVLGTE